MHGYIFTSNLKHIHLNTFKHKNVSSVNYGEKYDDKYGVS